MKMARLPVEKTSGFGATNTSGILLRSLLNIRLRFH